MSNNFFLVHVHRWYCLSMIHKCTAYTLSSSPLLTAPCHCGHDRSKHTPWRTPVLKPICLNPRSSQTESSAASCAWDMKHKQAATHSCCTRCSARDLPSSCRRTSTALFSRSIIIWSVHPSAEWMSRWLFGGANSDLWSSAALRCLYPVYTISTALRRN